MSANGATSASNGKNGQPLLQVRHLVKHFPITKGIFFQKQVGAVKAVDDISFDLTSGETLALVGAAGFGRVGVGDCCLVFRKPLFRFG